MKTRFVKIGLLAVAAIAIFVLLAVAGSVPTSAGSPAGAPPTVVLPTPVATKAPTVSPQQQPKAAPTRVLPQGAKVPGTTTTAKSPKGVSSLGIGTTDVSSFTIQNIDTAAATVTVTFYDESGTSYQPPTLNGSKANPFTLNSGESFEVYTPGIPSGLPSGRYSVVVSATAQIAAISNLVGSGTVNFNGSFSGFTGGAATFYLPSVVFNYYGWYSLLSVQNVGSAATSVAVTITCADGTTGTLSQASVPAQASVHFDLYATTPSGFSASTQCNGSAVVSAGSGGQIVAIDNQRVPTSGNTQSYNGTSGGGTTMYVPALYTGYYGWNASLNIRKVGSGSTDVTVTYSDAGTSTCNLTDAQPGCLLYMPSAHSTTGYFGASITSSALPVVAVANAANGSQAQTYSAVSGGTGTVGIPSVMKKYYGWDTSVTCQNVGSVASSFRLSYASYTGNAYDTASKNPGQTVEILTPNEAFLPSGYQGGLTVTANTSGAQLACIVNFANGTNIGTLAGDWSMSYNAFNK